MSDEFNTDACGTKAGYLRHSRQRKIDPKHKTCQACKKAWSLYYAKRRA